MHSLVFVSLICLSFVLSCKKVDNQMAVSNCDLQADKLLRVENETGTLVYTDYISGIKLSKANYFIIDTAIDNLSLPLEICNFPREEFSYLEYGDSVNVIFSGQIGLLSETVDALNLIIELRSIKKINNGYSYR